MPIQHLTPDATPDELAAVLAADGCVVIDRLASLVDRKQVMDELEPYMKQTPVGADDFSGRNTTRTGGLIGRSPASRAFVMHPLILATARNVLSYSKSIQLHLTQMIAIGGGSPVQSIHRDQWAFDFFPFPDEFEVQCNTIWAFDDFTEANGATRVIPGSNHFEDRQRFDVSDTEPAEMEAGSVLLYTGRLYHGGGANQTDTTRHGLNLTYNVSWLRQEENQYLSVPREIAVDLDDDLLRLMGYSLGAYALGYVDDSRDPLDALRGTVGTTGFTV